MSGFQKKVLNPIVSAIMQKIEAVQTAQDGSNKPDLLLTANDEADATLSELYNREANKAYGWSSVAAVCLCFVIAGALSFSLPSIIFGAITGAAGIAACAKWVRNAEDVAEDKKIIEAKIGRELANIAQIHPEEVSKSQRFQDLLKKAFNSAASDDEQYKKLAQRVTPTTPVRAGGLSIVA